jgi:hypothetical protein
VTLAAAALALAVGLLARRRRAAGGSTAAMPRFYARTLRALARRGLTPAPGETAREFARRVDAAVAGAPLARLTAAYERVRFGGMPLDPGEAAALDACAAALERAGR